MATSDDFVVIYSLHICRGKVTNDFDAVRLD